MRTVTEKTTKIIVPPASFDSIVQTRHRNLNVKNITQHKVPSFSKLPRTWQFPTSLSAETFPMLCTAATCLMVPRGSSCSVLICAFCTFPERRALWLPLFIVCCPFSTCIFVGGHFFQIDINLCFTFHFFACCLWRWCIHSLGGKCMLQ